MSYQSKDILEYWNREDIESMYDKNLLALEINLIRGRLAPGAKILDAGCGEGEGTLEYAKIPGTTLTAADFSDTRLEMASKRLAGANNVTLKKVDFLGDYSLDTDYDYIVSQRFLINIPEWRLQQKVLRDFHSLLKPGGKLLMLEGSAGGHRSLNQWRVYLGLEPIPVRWYNVFLEDEAFKEFMPAINFSLVEEVGLGEYFMLTRAIRPLFDKELHWDCEFNRLAANPKLQETLNVGLICSRLKLWVFQKAS